MNKRDFWYSRCFNCKKHTTVAQAGAVVYSGKMRYMICMYCWDNDEDVLESYRILSMPGSRLGGESES